MANKGNTYALKHGGAAGVKALASGDELTGLAQAAQHQVQRDLAELGPGGMVRRDAERLEAVASLYYQHLLGETDVDRLTALVKVWGWIQNSAVRTWKDVAQFEQADRQGLDAQHILDAIKGVKDDNASA